MANTKIKRDLPNDEYQAAVNSNNASITNVFATIADLSASTGDANRLVFDVKIDQTGGILKGQAVYVSGADGTNILVTKADNSSDLTSSKTLGLLISDGANNNQNQVIAEGILKGTGSNPLDTSSAIAGDPVWLGTNGNLLFGLINKPSAPQHLVFLGVVVEANPTVGEIFVKVQNGFELDEIHDVFNAKNANDADVLTYNSLTGLWEPKPIPTISSGNQLLSGGAAWSGTGLVYNVTALTYIIAGVSYSSLPQNATLSTADPTNPRFDAIVVNDLGVVSVITGTPSTNPVTPSVNEDYVLVQYILLPAGATAPTITTEHVYREGSAPDWMTQFTTGASPSLSVNFSSTFPTPFEGSQSTLVVAPSYNTGKSIVYAKPTGNIARSVYTFLVFRVFLPAYIPARNLYVRLYNGTTLIGAVYANSYGLNMTTFGSWQLVSIPISAFGNVGITTMSRVQFLLAGNAANTFGTNYDRYALDAIRFESGYATQQVVSTITVANNGTPIANTPKLNFIGGANVTISTINDTLNNEVDITINSSGATIIPAVTSTEVFRGRSFRFDSTTVDTYGGIVTLNNASALAVAPNSTIFSNKFSRLRYYASIVSTGRVTSIRSTDLQWFIHGGFRFVSTFRVADTAYSATCQNFHGLIGTTAEIAVGTVSLIQVSTLTNCIFVGNDGADANLQVMHNDASGTCTKIDLGANFPANRTAGAEMSTMYSIEIYNAVRSTQVKYVVTNLETGAIAQGTITTNLPATTQGLAIQSARVMSTATTNSGQWEQHKWGCSDIIL